MLVEFSISNFRSIKELQTINFIAAPLKKNKEDILAENLFPVNKEITLLKSIGIYGSNGSGKSNVVKGLLNFLVILRDVMSQEENLLSKKIEPFAFDDVSESNPTFFQIQFILNNKMYRYGFEATKQEIVTEWLFGPAEKNDTFYFTRNKEEGVKINEKFFPESIGLSKNLTKTNLFLNVVNSLNGNISREIKSYFTFNFGVSLGVSDIGFRTVTLDMMHDKISKNNLIEFLNKADFGIENVQELELDVDESHKINEFQKFKPLVGSRKKIGKNEKVIGLTEYIFDVFESEGTKKVFNYAGIIINTLNNGGVLVLDEFDAQLHPNLTRKLLKMFNSKQTNKKGAQLLFVTHDVNILNNNIVRRDQIFFAEKDLKGRSSFYSLYDVKGVRNDASFEKDYISGTYGAIPFLGDFNELFEADEAN